MTSIDLHDCDFVRRDTFAEFDPVRAAQVADDVAPVAAGEAVDVVARAAAQQVVAQTADEKVPVGIVAIAVEADQFVVAGSALEDIRSFAADDKIVALLPVQPILPEPAADRVGSAPPGDPVVVGIAIDDIVAAIAEVAAEDTP